MADSENGGKNISASVPLGTLGGLLVLGLAAAAYTYFAREGEIGNPVEALQNVKPKAVRRKVGLMTLVALIENDTTRRVLVALLKAMARRS